MSRQESQSTPCNAPLLILASGSPRRRELLKLLGATYTAMSNDAEEGDAPVPPHVIAALPPFPLHQATHPALLAWRKAAHAAHQAPEAVILGADTIVVLDTEVLNKPRDPDHARSMLSRLSGRTHTVYTGLCLIKHEQVWLDLVASDVEIAPLNATIIADYVATGEPLDKAGAYGIQGLGGNLVRRVHGSYTAVVGLPLPHTHRMLQAAGIDHLHDPEETYRCWLEQQGKEPLACPPTLP